MIIDSHCHAWRTWPYQPPVPDPTTRGTVEQLLFEMDQHGVERAVLVCARIDFNPDNNDYVAGCLKRFPERLYQFADVDCEWWPTHQAPGAADRLAAAVQTYNLRGFTHYVGRHDDGAWYLSDDGQAFFRMAADLNQIASLSLPARLQPVVRALATAFPSVPFLCHHMGGTRANEGPDSDALAEVLQSAAVPNIHIKLSGFHYVSPIPYAFPFPECRPIVQALYQAYGPERLHWGSDYPVVRRALTFQQSLEAVRLCRDIIPAGEMERILGDSLLTLLDHHGVG
jgi:predicted TIM-barrel fold metal-dependent hydrolase